jgi:hypothetical protein
MAITLPAGGIGISAEILAPTPFEVHLLREEVHMAPEEIFSGHSMSPIPAAPPLQEWTSTSARFYTGKICPPLQ